MKKSLVITLAALFVVSMLRRWLQEGRGHDTTPPRPTPP